MMIWPTERGIDNIEPISPQSPIRGSTQWFYPRRRCCFSYFQGSSMMFSPSFPAFPGILGIVLGIPWDPNPPHPRWRIGHHLGPGSWDEIWGTGGDAQKAPARTFKSWLIGGLYMFIQWNYVEIKQQECLIPIHCTWWSHDDLKTSPKRPKTFQEVTLRFQKLCYLRERRSHPLAKPRNHNRIWW